MNRPMNININTLDRIILKDEEGKELAAVVPQMMSKEKGLSGNFLHIKGKNCNSAFELIGVTQLAKMKEKAAKLAKLEAIVDACYEFDKDTGEPVNNGEDLTTIGEKVCTFLGHI